MDLLFFLVGITVLGSLLGVIGWPGFGGRR